VSFCLLSVLAVGVYSKKAQAQQYPMLDMVAGKVIQKYQDIHMRAVVDKKE
jgi:hypothetical protein